MAKGARLAANTLEIQTFKDNRTCFSENGIIWSTYCKVTVVVSGVTLTDIQEVRLFYKWGAVNKVDLVESPIINNDSVGSVVFSASKATFSYEGQNLIIKGTGKLGFYQFTIGEYAKEYVNKYIRND